MIGATFCSGIGAPELAAPWVDWVMASEIEDFPREVLAYRHGYKDARTNTGAHLLWGDFTALRMRHLRRLGVPLPEIVVAGTPCQSFSVAGLRRGLDDARGNLTLQFVRTCHAIVNARSDGRLTVLWENVPGILSDKTNAFGSFLGGMVGAMDALPPPTGTGWGREGMVEGPRARAAWAVLNSRWFGVAQRRRRVFVIIDFGNRVDPAKVLFERDSLRGDHPPGRETGEDVAALTANGVGSSGADDNQAQAGHLIAAQGHHGDAAGTVSSKWHKGSGGPAGDETQNMVALQYDVTHTLSAEGCDASEDGTGRGSPIVPVAIQERAVSENPNAGPDGAGFSQDGTAYTLEARPTVQAVAYDTTQITSKENKSNPQPGDPCHPLAAGAHAPLVAFDCKAGGKTGLAIGEASTSLRGDGHGGGHVAIANPTAVRRITPRECERLQDFPDDFTLIPRARKRVIKDIPAELAYLRQNYPDMTEDELRQLAADTPRYKALGNSMTVSVIKWIMDRIKQQVAA